MIFYNHNRMNTYKQNSTTVQPKREITISSSDIFYQFKPGDRLDQIADEYYGNKLASRVIMWANPKYYNEFEIRVGDIIRIPMPLDRVLSVWGMEI